MEKLFENISERNKRMDKEAVLKALIVLDKCFSE